MPVKTHPIFLNFNSGEISPKLEGRIDITRYHNGVHEMRNGFCLPQGGWQGRGGFHYVAETKDSGEARLIPFCFSELQNYILEFGDKYIRFFMDCGQIMDGDEDELVINGEFDADIDDWDDLSTGTGYIQWDTDHMEIIGGVSGPNVGWAEQEITTVAETLYILKFDVAAYPLKVRIGTTSGGNEILDDTEFDEGIDQIVFVLAETTSTFIQFKNSNNNLAELDNVSFQIAIPFQIDSPYELDYGLHLIKYVQDDENLYKVHPDYPPQILTRTSHIDWTINPIDFIDGPYEDEIDTPAITPTGTVTVLESTITLTAAAPGCFLPGHEGALWRIRQDDNWGYVKILEYTSATVVSAVVKKALKDETASEGHREGAWSDVNGWPRSICFYEGRLLFGGNYEHPQTIWGSKVWYPTDMTPGTEDADPYSFTASEINIIRWITSGRVLSIGAFSGEVVAQGSNDGIITATEPPRIKTGTDHGSYDLHPLKIGKTILFLQKAGKKIREFAYSYADDAYNAPDLTVISDHLFEEGIIDLAYQQEPIPIVWALRSDGDLLGCTYERSQDVVGWHRHYTDGYFESIACIPYQNADQLWAIVQREIGEETKRYIEYLDPQIHVDSGLTYSGSKTTVISGLDHLIGKDVEIVGDGAVYPPQEVPESGELTINPGASEIYVGLAYTPRLVTNRPEVQVSGTSQGLKKRWNKIIVRVLDTMGIKINDQIIPARASEDLMDEAPEPFSGDINVENLGWDTDGRITIEQPQPLPVHVVCITGSLIIGDD